MFVCVLGVLNDNSMMVINKYVESNGVELNRFTVGSSQSLCQKKLYKEAADKEDKRVITKNKKYIISHDKINYFSK